MRAAAAGLLLAVSVAACGRAPIDARDVGAPPPSPAANPSPWGQPRNSDRRRAASEEPAPSSVEPADAAQDATERARIAELRHRVEDAARACVVDLSANDLAADLGEAGVAALVDLAESAQDDEVRSIAYYTLWYMPARAVRTPAGRKALAGMLAWLAHPPKAEDPRENLRVVLPIYLWLAGPDAAAFSSQIAALLRSQDPWVRGMALRAVIAGDRFLRDTWPAVVACAGDPSAETRALAARALDAVGVGQDECGPPLLRLAVDADEPTRREAANALRHLLPRVDPNLLAPLDAHPDAAVRDVAEQLRSAGPRVELRGVTGDIEPEETASLPDDVPALVETLDRPAQRAAALCRLARLGPRAAAAKAAVRSVIERAVEPDWAVPCYVAICRDEPSLVDDLVSLLEGIDREALRATHTSRAHADIAAALALGTLADRARPALPALRLAALSSHDALRSAANEAIRRIELR